MIIGGYQIAVNIRKRFDKRIPQAWPFGSQWNSRDDVINTSHFHLPEHKRVRTSRTKFSLRGRDYNIPAIRAWNIQVCIAFMHRKSE